MGSCDNELYSYISGDQIELALLCDIAYDASIVGGTLQAWWVQIYWVVPPMNFIFLLPCRVWLLHPPISTQDHTPPITRIVLKFKDTPSLPNCLDWHNIHWNTATCKHFQQINGMVGTVPFTTTYLREFPTSIWNGMDRPLIYKAA